MFTHNPVDTPYDITLEYGQTEGYKLNNGFHRGIDLVSKNRRVYLVEDAKIELYPNNGADGNAIYFTKGNMRVAYCHLAGFAVKAGTYPAGTYLGQMGDTGEADGIHLHLAVRINGELVNPKPLIKGEDMAKIKGNAGIMDSIKWLVTRQKITKAEVDKYQDDLEDFVQYLTRVQSEHGVAPVVLDQYERNRGEAKTATPKQIAAEKAMEAIKEYTKL